MTQRQTKILSAQLSAEQARIEALNDDLEARSRKQTEAERRSSELQTLVDALQASASERARAFEAEKDAMKTENTELESALFKELEGMKRETAELKRESEAFKREKAELASALDRAN
eukprot:2561987-Rhodomonas_salina.1